MNFLKNIILLIVVLVLGYFTAEYFGTWYDKFSPQYDNTLGLSKNVLINIVGFPFAYVFFITFLFKLFALGNKKKWIIWLLIPPALFFAAGDLKHIYLPIALGLIAFYLAKILRVIYSKMRGYNNA